MLHVAAAWALLGWLTGAAAARLSFVIAGPSAQPSVSHRWARFRPLAPDPPLQAASGLSFGLLAWWIEPGLALVVSSGYALVLLALLVVDARTRFVYDAMVYPPLALAVILTPAASGTPFWDGLAGAIVGGGIFGVIYIVGKRAYGGITPMGAGDITLAALMGAMLGSEHVLTGLFLATVLGATIGLGYALRFRSLRVSMPYGPGICLAGLIILLVRAWG